MKTRLLLLVGVLTSVSLGAATGAARADWLVLRDGSRVQTKGAWQVKGKQVVFSQANGQLAALRMSDVDLDASAKATAESTMPAQAAPAPEVAKKKPVLVLSDKDVGHVDAAGAPQGDPKAGADPAPDAQPVAQGAVQVDTWEKVKDPASTGIQIFGSIKNTSKETATDITVTVKVLDEAGGLLASVDATISSSVLTPGAATNFRAAFPGILDFVNARFEVRNRSLLTKESPPPAGGVG